jgi:hypothetical protein
LHAAAVAAADLEADAAVAFDALHRVDHTCHSRPPSVKSVTRIRAVPCRLLA